MDNSRKPRNLYLSIDMYRKESRRYSFLIILIVAVLLPSCTTDKRNSTPIATLTPSPTSPNSAMNPSPTSFDAESGESNDWIMYTDSSGGYSLPVPRDWPVQGLGGGMIAFQDPRDNAGGEDATIIGGVDILARYPGPNEFLAVLPNHSEQLDERRITTSAGAARLFMLKRETLNQMWLEQHAYIPVDNRFYDIWLKIGAESSAAPAPRLARMLAGFHLTGTFMRSTPLPTPS